MRAVCLVLCSVVLGQWQAFGASQKHVAAGVWRGEGIELTVGDEGANVEFSCARAEIKGPIVLDKKGRFEVSGDWYPEHHGPVRDGVPAQQAKFSGREQGKTITMTVELVGQESRSLGDFELVMNGTSRLKKCR